MHINLPMVAAERVRPTMLTRRNGWHAVAVPSGGSRPQSQLVHQVPA